MEVGSCSYNYSNFDQPSSSSHQRSSSRLTQAATDCSRYKEEGTFEEDEEQNGARVRELVGGTGSSGLAASTGAGEATKDPRPKGWTSSSSKTGMNIEAVEETTADCQVQQEGGVALWVKWRGKWRACIQCFPSDCSAATAKAMPTYNKKTYVVVFFPNSRTYFWVDLQFACHISESPEPLAFGTHESGRRAVENLDMPKHHMLQVLTTSMLDISDKLPIKAVVRSAQNVKAWKDFANDAMKAKEYNDISNMLVRLFWMIDPSYYSKQWLKEGFANWKEGCEKANTAQAVENLNKELVGSILWDDIQPLWDAPEQAVVGAEWKDWKYTVLENKSLFPTVMPSPDSTLYVDDSFAKRRRIYRAESAEHPSLDSAAKRSKLKVRRNGLPDLNSGAAAAEGCCVVSTDNQSLDKPSLPSTPASTLKLDEDPTPVWTSKRLASNYQLCSAYMEKKKRQCTRFPSQGSLFCCKHMALASGEVIEGVKRMDAVGEQRRPIVSEQKPVVPQHKSTTILPKSPNDRICEGNTKFGRRCTHRAREGSLFCKKHTFADAPHLNSETGERISGPPPSEVKNVEANGQEEEKQAAASPGQPEETQVMNESEDQSNQVHTSSGKRKPVSYFPSDRSYPPSWHAKRIGRLIKHNSGERVRCLGKCVNGEQCSHKSRPGFSYCEKHQPDMTGEAKPESDADTGKQDAAEVLVKARSLLSRYMEIANRKADGENESALLRWILEDVSRDPPVAECLMKLVTQRKEKLGKFLELSEASKAMDVETGGEKSSGFDRDQETPKPLPDEQQLEQLEKQLEKIRCSICSEDFDEMVELGRHWKSSHMTEAHWFLRGYLCKECDKDFTNKSSFERHCKAVHEGATEVACVAVCINCDEQFCDFKALFDHVVASHSDHLSAMPTISLPANGGDMEATKMEDDAQEQNNDESAAANGIMDESGDESFEFPSSLEDSLDEVDGEKEDYDDGTGPMRFKCKICSKRFKLLPELGRHHQLAHMPAQLASPMTKLNSGSMRSSRKQSHDEAVRRIKAALQTVEKSKADGDGVKQLDPPNNQELISEARNACCEANLRAKLEQKYESVPKELLGRVLKLAGGINVPKWTREGYICARTCKQVGQLVERAADTRTHVFRKSNILKKKSSVLCEDMSFGKEPLPIPCVEDEDTEQCICSHCREGKSYYVDSERPWETFTYITKRMLDPSLGVDTKDSQIGCACGKHHCSAKSCLHVYLFDNDNAEASDIWGEEMAGRFPYDDQGRIILQEGYLVYECNSSCPCQPTCPNRVLQRGVNVKLEVFKTRHKGWAVRAAQHIPRGTFVCEYLGEVLNDQEANRRGERYDQVGCSYLYDIDVHLNRGRSRRGPRVKPFVIDATKYGNASRFMNHSCSPNLVNYQVLVESMDSRLAHIGLYASRDIACGEELSYDYRYKLLPGRGCPCHCGSSGCRGRLY